MRQLSRLFRSISLEYLGQMVPETLCFELLSRLDSSTLNEPRIGKLSSPGRKPVDTPNFFGIASRGVIPHMTPDVIISHTQVRGVHLSLEDFMTFLDPPSLSSISALPKTIITLLAPRQTPAVVSPAGNSDSAISAFTSSGFRPLTGQDYIHFTRKLCPDIIIGLADVPYGVKPGAKRLTKMGRRTQRWLAEMLREDGLDQAVFAPILPISASEQSDYLDYILDDAVSQLSGLAFYDSTLLPEIPATTALSKLPRLSLDEPSSPLDILAQISLGMDLFTLPFLGFATEAGIALSFRFPRPLSQGETPPDTGPEPLGIDMGAPAHANSLTPLLEGCNCYTCRSHHRAYVQHLLSAKEMLGRTLLQAHNYHILSEFFTSIRRSITVGRFNADREEFARAYVGTLPEKIAQTPRARGYHFKSKQPNEDKPAPANGTCPMSLEGLPSSPQ